MNDIDTEVLAALRKARDTVARGWCQGTWGGPVGPNRTLAHCAEGAIMAVTPRYSSSYGDVMKSMTVRERVHAALRIEIQANYPRYRSIPGWNDAPERTKDEVLAMFDKAILHVEESVQ